MTSNDNFTSPHTDNEDHVGSALFGQSPADLRPLVALLRSEEPLSTGTRDMLAELLDPDGDGYLYLRLVIKDCSSKANSIDRDHEAMMVTGHYRKLVSSGVSSQVAALETADVFGISDRQVFRLKKDWDRRLKWLKGRQE